MAIPFGHLDVVGHDGHVLEVQRGVDLIQHIQRRGLVVVQGKDQRQGAQRLGAGGEERMKVQSYDRRENATNSTMGKQCMYVYTYNKSKRGERGEINANFAIIKKLLMK